MSSTKSPTHVMSVVHVNALAPQIIQLLLKADRPLQYHAGDYIMLGFDAEELKPFSIADAPRDDGLIECHIRKQPDSEWMEKLFAITPGDTLVLQGPNAQMSLKPAHGVTIFIAGGTGFAPLRALLVESIRQNITTPITFYWGARTPEELYMHDWLIDLTQRHSHIEYIPVISDETDQWHGETGLVHETLLRQHPNLSHASVYMCGPWPMIQTAKQAFFEAGLPKENLTH